MSTDNRRPTFKYGYIRVRVKWNALKYYQLAGLYRTQQEITDKINKLRETNPDLWNNVHINPFGIYIDAGARHIAQYNGQSDKYVGRDILRPIMTLPIFDRIYYTDE